MKKNLSGSTILIVVLVISAIVICTTITWQGSAFLENLVLKRQKYEQKYRFTEGLLNYGIAFCKQNYDMIQLKRASFKGKKSFCIPLVDGWQIDSHQKYGGKVYVTVHKKSIDLKAVLIKGGKRGMILSCNISRCSLPKEKHNPEKKYDNAFIIQNFNIGSK